MQLHDCRDKTDEEMVNLILENQDYFLCLMERYEEKLIRYIMRISNSEIEDAEDTLQEVFIKVYQNLNDFDQELKFSSWIYRITHNLVISKYRKAMARPQIVWDEDSKILNNIISEFDINQKIDSEILRTNIKTVLNKLDEKYKEVLVLRFLEDKDYNEISDILKKPMGTIATLINRAKKIFGEELEKSNIKI